jgi:LacI family transcriptional regulator
MPATIDDVATRAKVSSMTVSLVARQQTAGRVSAETAARVRRAMLDLDYHPNVAARNVRAKRSIAAQTHCFGYLFHTKSQPSLHPYYADILIGANEAVQQCDYHLLMGHGHASFSGLKSQLKLLTNYKVDGWLLASIHNQPLIDFIAEAKIPAVWIGSSVDVKDRISQVRADDFQGGYLALKHLTEMGHRHIVYVDILRGAGWYEATMQGGRKALDEAGLDGLAMPPLFHDSNPRELANIATQIVRSQPRPTAVLIRSDQQAVILMQYLRQHGLEVPRDISIVGYDGLEIGAHSHPALTTVSAPRREMGIEAVKLLRRTIAGGQQAPQTATLPVHLEVRESTAIANKEKVPM